MRKPEKGFNIFQCECGVSWYEYCRDILSPSSTSCIDTNCTESVEKVLSISKLDLDDMVDTFNKLGEK